MKNSYAMPVVKEDKHSLMNQINEFILCAIIIYVFVTIIEWFCAPFYRKTTRNDYRQRIENKQDAREEYLEQIANDLNDPMYQYQIRFLEEVSTYRRDPDNKVYASWYESWKKGEVLDTTLRWVPVMYTESDEMTPEFVAYMKIQYFLHKDRAGFLDRIKFMRTIRKYYPEFSATYRGMGEDLARYCSIITEYDMEETLRKEIKKFGLPDDYVDYLLEQEVSPKELREAALFFRDCVAEGIRLEAAVTSYTNKAILSEAIAIEKSLKTFDETFDQKSLPARVVLAYIRQEATLEQVEKLMEYTATLDEPEGDEYEDYIDSQLKKFRAKKRAVKFI